MHLNMGLIMILPGHPVQSSTVLWRGGLFEEQLGDSSLLLNMLLCLLRVWWSGCCVESSPGSISLPLTPESPALCPPQIQPSSPVCRPGALIGCPPLQYECVTLCMFICVCSTGCTPGWVKCGGQISCMVSCMTNKDLLLLLLLLLYECHLPKKSLLPQTNTDCEALDTVFLNTVFLWYST